MVAIIDGRALAAELRARVADEARALEAEKGVRPTLAVVLVGEDPASHIYVKRKLQASAGAGISSREHRLTRDISEVDLLALIDGLNADADIHGILVQLPLPAHINATLVLDRIDPRKDVDGFHPVNVGRLSIGHGALVPCTPLGCMRLLDTVIETIGV